MVTRTATRSEGIGSRLPLHPLLFAAYPVIRLYGQNISEIDLDEIFVPLLMVVGITAVLFAVLSALLRDPRRAAIVTSAVILPVMLFGLLFEVVQPLVGEERLFLLAIVVAVVAVVVVLALRAGPRLGSITLVLNVISLVLLLAAVIPATQGVAAVFRDDGGSSSSRTVNAANGETPSRDIYHIVVDRYGSEQALETGFGIDNADFVAWLRDNGFDVVDHARANYAKTTLSLGSTLGMSLLDDIVEAEGPDSENLTPVVRRIKQSRAGAFLQGLGYEYIHIGSWFKHTRVSRIADRSFVPVGEVSLATTLYDLSVLPVLADRDKPTDAFSRKHADAAEYQFGILDELADDPGPKYVFAHILLPHPPYVFVEDGTYRPEDATFETQLVDTNRRLRELIEPLLALPEDERPIIILQADEGPFPVRLAADERGFEWASATDEELATKFGILSAMYLPGPEGTAPLPSNMTAVNTYPELFRRYFGSDIEDQPDRILASSKVTPYDMLDVTERVNAALGVDAAPD